MPARAHAPTPRTLRRRAFLAALALLGCNLENPGDEPPAATIYFPNALALSPHAEGEAPRFLFVANSNFDLRFKSGTVQALSLEKLDDELAGCEGACDEPLATRDVLEDEVYVGSFSTSLAIAPASDDAGEAVLFVTTRTDDELAFIRVDPSADGDRVLRCEGSGPQCGLHAASAIDPSSGDRFAWPADPTSVVAGLLADWPQAGVEGDDTRRYALVSHRAGQVSLFVEDPDAAADSDERFVLTAVLSGLPGPLNNVAFDPSTRLAHFPAGVNGLARVGVAFDSAVEGRGVLYRADTLQLQAAPGQPNTLDIVFLPAATDAGQVLAEDTALIVSDDPSTLLLADVDELRNAPRVARIKRTAVVGAGASRVAAGTLRGRPVAVVACFTARAVFVVDLTTMLTRSVVPNLSGPFDVALDEARERLYVTDFRSSVIRVIDLSALAESEGEVSARLLATIGTPRVVQELR